MGLPHPQGLRAGLGRVCMPKQASPLRVFLQQPKEEAAHLKVGGQRPGRLGQQRANKLQAGRQRPQPLKCEVCSNDGHCAMFPLLLRVHVHSMPLAASGAPSITVINASRCMEFRLVQEGRIRHSRSGKPARHPDFTLEMRTRSRVKYTMST